MTFKAGEIHTPTAYLITSRHTLRHKVVRKPPGALWSFG